MNDIRRTILWVIFGFSMVMLWDQWQVYNGRPGTFLIGTHKPAASAPAARSSAPASTPVAGGQPPVATPAAGALPGTPTAAPAVAAERFTITTDVMKVTFDTQGGTIVRTEFSKHPGDKALGHSDTFVLLDQTPDHTYVAQSGLVGGDFPNHTTVMKASGDRALKEGANELVVKFEGEKNGVKLVKTFTFHRGAYDAAVKHEVFNTATAPVSPQLYVQIVRDGRRQGSGNMFTDPTSTFTGPAVYTEEHKFQKVEFGDIDKNKIEFQKTSSKGYVAMVQHYFASAWILPDGVPHENFIRKVENNYAVGMITPPQPVPPGAAKAYDAKFFAGPQEETMLERVAPGLELVKDYGVFTIISKPLYWLLSKLHGFLGNWGWAIVGLVLLIKVAFFWLQAKAYESMAKMKAINPKVMQLRERYKDNPQMMQQEMMRIYREEKVNPLGGCLPIMIQIPVFIALYWVLLSSVEMRNAPWIGWIHDLSHPDPLFILPVIMTLTTLLQTALNPAPPDPMQAKMMWIMPMVFAVMFFFFPAGLVLYWVTNNILSIAQQWLINRRMGVKVEFNLPKFK
ncbi:membrane protein insertase YidC [Ramlibacter albus]|uniref:Membrane protein insertase YidC n=1 Tax=Ramlibacter albus TaxID=2079448 RepID=A0A923M6M8_9BURK|nr:membrane protein insertase YidC [Ramlibacter albus]MBC5763751.1 membrane protein insertase YidC [Ramlibacter albus]